MMVPHQTPPRSAVQDERKPRVRPAAAIGCPGFAQQLPPVVARGAGEVTPLVALGLERRSRPRVALSESDGGLGLGLAHTVLSRVALRGRLRRVPRPNQSSHIPATPGHGGRSLLPPLRVERRRFMGRGEAVRLTDGGAWSCGGAATQGKLAEAAAPCGGIVLVQVLGESGWRRAGSSRAGSRPDLGLEDHCRCKLDTAAERRTVAPSCSVELWEIIVHGYREPQDPIRLTSTEFYNRQLNASARDKIRSGINRKLLDQVNDIDSAKELWDRIIVLQEGTDLIQSALYETAKQEAHQFMIREGESVADAYARLGALRVRVKGLGVEKYNDGFEMNEAFIKSKVIAMIAVN
ncbi:hypothetical protein QYE76_008234 [Lolium multiflorum]|uniref:Uncharacterized protein n=1 Tax=Lolium multiflorum TaxID=4521 RepID=A0AAD8V560_LOLMU|nr:hypothetical protein QYE76_008234 [Lolium multiflorum]